MPPARGVAVHRGERNLVVDGSLQDWPSLVPLRLDDVRQLSGTADGAWSGPVDLAARLFLLWDEEFLYLGGQVSDDVHITLGPDRPGTVEVPPADAVVLRIDRLRDTLGLGPDSNRDDDRVFWLGKTEGGGFGKAVVWDQLAGTAEYVPDSVVAVRRVESDQRTDVEVRLPWASILGENEAPQSGLVLGVQLSVEDFDRPEDPLAQSRIGWTFGSGARIDPGSFGGVVLVRSLDQPEGVEVPPPDPERRVERPEQTPEYWVQWLDDLRTTAPSLFTADDEDPAAIGTELRMRLLRRFEAQLERFPRADLIAFCHRIARRMNREVEGISERGLPFFWRHALGDVARRAMDPPPEPASFRLFRLPQGGWMVRSRWGNFGIDPTGYEIENELWGGMQFVLLTLPLDETRRNDRLLQRMLAQKPPRPVYTHVGFPLPLVDAEDMPAVRIGSAYRTDPFVVVPHAIRRDEELVSVSAGYTVVFPDGARLVVSGRELREEDVREPVDLLLLDPAHPRAAVIGQRVGADVTVVDRTLQPHGPLRWGARVTLDEAFELQSKLRPHTSLLLAPGEFVDVHPGR
jgi:hypothetical protein